MTLHNPIFTQETETTGVVYVLSALPWNGIASAAAETNTWTWVSIVYVVAIFVSVALLLHLLISVLRIIHMYHKHQHSSLRDVNVVITEEQTAPFSFFKWLFWRHDIDPDSENGKRMLQHELTHISEKHSADKLFVELLLVAFWMNPFFLDHASRTVCHPRVFSRSKSHCKTRRGCLCRYDPAGSSSFKRTRTQ